MTQYKMSCSEIVGYLMLLSLWKSQVRARITRLTGIIVSLAKRKVKTNSKPFQAGKKVLFEFYQESDGNLTNVQSYLEKWLATNFIVTSA